MITSRPAPAPTALIALALLLDGCGQRTVDQGSRTLEDRYASLGVPSLSSVSPSGAGERSDRTARAPGPAPRLVPSLRGFTAERVVERDLGRARETRVVLRSDGPGSPGNYLEAVVGDSQEGLLTASEKPTEASVRQTLNEQFPGIRMQVLTTQRYNAYGPYGLALGVTPDGERCAYAWQWTDPKRAAPAGLRARICTPKLSLDELAARLDRIALETRDPARKPPRRRRLASASVQPVAAQPRVAIDRPPALSDRRYLVAPETPDRIVPSLPSDIAGPASASAISLPPEALRGPDRTSASKPATVDVPTRPASRT